MFVTMHRATARSTLSPDSSNASEIPVVGYRKPPAILRTERPGLPIVMNLTHCGVVHPPPVAFAIRVPFHNAGT